ncbi:MAG TPA: 3-oxoacyl-[acyl-carrier-protein] synthase III C-terminal domain-containing protein [Terriglobia bacterium]|nr:3-oxoacyl-[acyl-carrier-protein] synthase III C-terminal domain-containing protein [Terriglobia bacterium]
MSEVYVDHLTFALGDETRSVEDAQEQGLTVSKAADLREAGFTQHHVCRRNTTAYDLASRAVSNIRDHVHGTGAIVYSTCIPINGNIGDEKKFRETRDVKHLMDFPASHLQADFGLDRAFVVGLNQQACTGVLGSLRLARVLLTAEPHIEQVLCVTSDRFPEGALYEQAYNLISDGAVACVVSNSPGAFRLVACHAITNGAMAQASDDETVGSYFNYTHRVINETLAMAGLTMHSIDWVVPQNTNKKAWQILARLLRFDYERVYFSTLSTVGHLISGDNIINLRGLIDEQRIRPGDRLLLFMAGYGLNWQCVILEKT